MPNYTAEENFAIQDLTREIIECFSTRYDYHSHYAVRTSMMGLIKTLDNPEKGRIILDLQKDIIEVVPEGSSVDNFIYAMVDRAIDVIASDLILHQDHDYRLRNWGMSSSSLQGYLNTPTYRPRIPFGSMIPSDRIFNEVMFSFSNWSRSKASEYASQVLAADNQVNQGAEPGYSLGLGNLKDIVDGCLHGDHRAVNVMATIANQVVIYEPLGDAVRKEMRSFCGEHSCLINGELKARLLSEGWKAPYLVTSPEADFSVAEAVTNGASSVAPASVARRSDSVSSCR